MSHPPDDRHHASSSSARAPASVDRGRHDPKLEEARWEHFRFGRDQPPGSRLRRQLARPAWLVLAIVLALGSAGVVAALQPLPDGANRPDLTWAADSILSGRLDGATHELMLLKGDVDILGDQTRATLAAVAQANDASLTMARNMGNSTIDSIETRRASLDGLLDCSRWNDSFRQALAQMYNTALVERYNDICLAIESVVPLKADWQSLVAGSQTAMQVAADIDGHDQVAAAALQLATQGRYTDALAKLSEAAAKIADATGIAATESKTADVSTLTSWLSRTTAMDQALATLWNATIASNGRVTSEVTAALKNVNSAKALLPDSNAVLQIVLHELAGSMTGSGISIETARGALAVAVADLTAKASPGQ